ncbi:MAG TPA: type I-C CRISPR-associated protein Cas8c/Csd1 [Candidatus Eisenbacteria bacterium]|nr:type I-C CRISPR-associated protein Cas8c/Csd1 [Candidatus Eisenbacteria bacterium]
MLLKHLYDFAHSRRLLDDLAFDSKPVRWIIELDTDGNLLGAGPQATGDDKRGKEFSCPQTTRPKVAGGVSEFLADGLTAVFGLDADPEGPMPAKKRSERDENNAHKRDDFWRQFAEAAQQTEHSGLQAALKFRQRLVEPTPEFLRWGKVQDAKEGAKSAWWLRTASGTEVRLGPENFTFRVNGELLLENESLRQFWRDLHGREVAQTRTGFRTGICLISGRPDQPLAPTHNPKIQGVPNTQSFGASIVSFDKDAFASYGFDQSLNAPTSDEAATAYCVALNWLIGHADHSLRLSQTTLCFWARQTESVGSLFARLLNRPDPQSVAQFLKSPWAGIERELAHRDQFFAVTLAGNSGRIVVRHWVQEPLDQAIENFHEWFADLELHVPPKANPKSNKKPKASGKTTEFHPLSVYWLACTTVREAKDLAPDVPAQLYRAALERTAPSVSLIKSILNQLHAKLVSDENYNPLYDESRFALLKLILNRNRKDTDMELKPDLTADTDDPAYNCGRLLSVFNETQKKAHEYGLKGATVAEKYFGTASTSPAYVFPYLVKLNRHHLQKISKSAKYAGGERFLEEDIFSILARLGQTEEMRQKKIPPAFPRILDLQAQGRFALGFYQQMAADAAARQASRKNNDTKTETETK